MEQVKGGNVHRRMENKRHADECGSQGSELRYGEGAPEVCRGNPDEGGNERLEGDGAPPIGGLLFLLGAGVSDNLGVPSVSLLSEDAVASESEESSSTFSYCRSRSRRKLLSRETFSNFLCAFLSSSWKHSCS